MERISKFWNVMTFFIIFLSCMTLLSCSNDNDEEALNPQEKIIGKWICYEDAYGEPWDEPLVYQFDSGGTGYEWFQDEPFSHRMEFTYTITESKIRIKADDSVYNIRYEISSNGKSLVLYGLDDNDMEVLHFVKQ